ncbi:MAG: tetratricopeptide repeat protein [Phycisphaerales bacterium]|nr:MAG: tetratricopeptide repeat protein [Phycisphaerales bacterium]
MTWNNDRTVSAQSSQPQHGCRPEAPNLVVRLACLLIVVATVVAFAPVLSNDFVSWDDDYALIRNDAYRGLSWQHLHWMFTTSYTGHYQPLTWLSFAIDFKAWGGLDPTGFHLTNLLLHLLTSLGFFFVAKRLIEAALPDHSVGLATIGALAAGLLFAIHPLRVESVAWATERRDVLCGALLMLTMLLYLRATAGPGVSSRRRTFLAVSILCYLLSLLAKASAITLPVLLLLLDMYPLRRVGGVGGVSRTGVWRRVLTEKVLFAVPAAVVAGLAIHAQAGAGALRSLAEHSISLRVGQAMYGIMFYLWKTVWPVGLLPLYEQDPHARALDHENVLSACLVIAITVVCWHQRRRRPGLLLAWAAYIVLLAPVMGLAQSGPQLVADRYSYLSCMPWSVLIGGGLAWVWAALPNRRMNVRVGLSIAVLTVVAILVILTRSQTRVWADSETLWRTVIARAPNTGTAQANLAVVLNEKGEHAAARDRSREALSILPGNRVAHIALARASTELGDLPMAERHYGIALDIRPQDPATILNLAAIETRLGRFGLAEMLYSALVALEPSEPAWHYNFGAFLAGQGRDEEARRALEQTLELDPTFPDAGYRLGVVLLKLEEPGRAITAFEEVLERTPNDPRANAKLAWVLATCRIDDLRDGSRALNLARRAIEKDDGENLANLEALAAAFAETGEYADAIATLERALADETHQSRPEAIQRLRLRLESYRAGQPVRE